MTMQSYECEECGLRFYTLDGLTLHTQILHGPKVEVESVNIYSQEV